MHRPVDETGQCKTKQCFLGSEMFTPQTSEACNSEETEKPKKAARKVVRETPIGTSVYKSKAFEETVAQSRHSDRGASADGAGGTSTADVSESEAEPSAVEIRNSLRVLNSMTYILKHSTFGGADRRRGVLSVAADLLANVARLQERPLAPSELSRWATKNVPGVSQPEIDAAAAGSVVPWRPSQAAIGAAIHLTWEEWAMLSPWGVWPEGAAEADIENARRSAKQERDREQKREERGGLKRDPNKETITDASKRLKRSRQTIHAWIRKGKLIMVDGLWTKADTLHSVACDSSRELKGRQSVKPERARRKPSDRASNASAQPEKAPHKQPTPRPGAVGAGRGQETPTPAKTTFTADELGSMVSALDAGQSSAGHVLQFRNPLVSARLFEIAAGISSRRADLSGNPVGLGSRPPPVNNEERNAMTSDDTELDDTAEQEAVARQLAEADEDDEVGWLARLIAEKEARRRIGAHLSEDAKAWIARKSAEPADDDVEHSGGSAVAAGAH